MAAQKAKAVVFKALPRRITGAHGTGYRTCTVAAQKDVIGFARPQRILTELPVMMAGPGGKRFTAPTCCDGSWVDLPAAWPSFLLPTGANCQPPFRPIGHLAGERAPSRLTMMLAERCSAGALR